MNEEARKAWKTPDGAHLFESMLTGRPLSQEDKIYLQILKQIDPPKIRAKAQPESQLREDSAIDDLEALTQQWLQERSHLSAEQLAQEFMEIHKERLARRQASLDEGIHVSLKPMIPYWPYLPKPIQEQVDRLDPL
jgi:hypothetical protein